MIIKNYIDVSGGQLHYRITEGHDEVPVIMIHKSASSSLMFEGLMVELAPDYKCLAFDIPGFGGSFDPELVQDIGFYVDTFYEAITKLGIVSAHLVGHHTGACICTEMAVKYPGFAKSLVLMGPPVLEKSEREKFKESYCAPFNKPVKDGSHLMLTWEYLSRMGVGDCVNLHQREFLDHARAWKGRNQAYSVVWEQDFKDLYLKVACPILITCAEDDVLWPYFERAQSLRPDASVLVTKGANFEPDIDMTPHIEPMKVLFQRK